MNLEEKLKKQQYKEIWQQYCGFLDLSMDGYMKIQRRLMEEQIRLWSNCGLGQSILKGKHPTNLDEFRKMVPLTTYEGNSAWLQVCRVGNNFAFHYSADSTNYYMMRYFHLPSKPIIKVGLLAQAPSGNGGKRIYEHLSIERKTVKNIRSGK